MWYEPQKHLRPKNHFYGFRTGVWFPWLCGCHGFSPDCCFQMTSTLIAVSIWLQHSLLFLCFFYIYIYIYIYCWDISPWWPLLELLVWYPGFISSHCHSCEDCTAATDFIYAYPISKWAVLLILGWEGTKAYDVTIQRYCKSHKKIKVSKCIFCGVSVKKFVWNFKGHR